VEVYNAEEMKEVLEKTWDQYGDTAVVDEFIAGREIRCGTVELEPGVITPLGCIEYKIDSDKIRTYDDKLEGDAKNLMQAASTTSWFIDECEEPKLVKKLQDLARRVHIVMKCKDFCQVDCRVSGKEEVYILEVNSFCSFGPLSLVPKIAKKVGISHSDLYKILLHNAALKGTKKPPN